MMDPGILRMKPINIPSDAPTGIYEYRAQVGQAPCDVLAERNFFFLVQP